MSNKLKEAIALIENEGGIVIFESSLDEPQIDIQSEKEKAEKIQWLKDYEYQKNQVRQKFDSMIKSPNTSVAAIEDMCISEGCDLDTLEEIIHSYY